MLRKLFRPTVTVRWNFIEKETADEIVFRANHGSNAYTIKGTFPQDKQEMIEKVEWMKQHPEIVRPQGLRGF